MALTSQENAFDFYLRFAKPLVLNLTEPDDRVLAAAWIQKLRDENVGDDRLRTDYLKLLLFVLQRNKLIGPFAENPNNLQQLNDLPEYKLKDVAKELLESEEQLRNKYAKDGVGEYSPPYTTEYSADLLEYAAAQIIPNFGIHAYYAISNEPLSCWKRTEKVIFPRGTFSETDQTHKQTPQLTESLSDPSLSPKHVKFKFEQRTIFHSPAYSSPIPQKSPRVSPSAPRSLSPLTLEGERERSPPTWGSNLIGVTDPPIKDYIPPSPLVKELMDELGMSTQEDDQYRSTTVRFSPQRPCTDRTCHPSPIMPEGFHDISGEQEPSFMEGFYSPPPLSPKSPKPYGSPIMADEFDEIFYEQEPSFKRSRSSPRPLCPRATPSPAKSPKPYGSPIIPDEFDDIFYEQEPSCMGSPFSPPPLSPRATPSPAKSSKTYGSPIIPDQFDDFFYEQEPSCMGSPFTPPPRSARATPSPTKSPEPHGSPIIPDEFDDVFYEHEPSFKGSRFSPPPLSPRATPSPGKSPKPYGSPIIPDDFDDIFYEQEPSFMGSPFSPPPLSPRVTRSPAKSPKPFRSPIIPKEFDEIFEEQEPVAMASPRPSPASPKSPLRSPKRYRSPIATQKLDEMFEQEPSSFTRHYSPASPSPKRYYSPIMPDGGVDGLFEEEQPSFMEVPFSPPPLSPGETWGVRETSSICIDGDIMSVGESNEFKAFDQMLDEFEREKPPQPTSTRVRTTKIPLPRGRSGIPSSSRIPKPGGSSRRIPIRTDSSKGSRIPQPGQKIKPRIQPPAASTSPLPQQEMNAFYIQSPPTFPNNSSLESVGMLEDPSLPLRTPSPRRPNEIKIEDISLTTSPYPTKPIKDLDPGPDFLETLGLSSDQLGDLVEESEPFIQEEPTPVENVPEQKEEIQESPELPRPPVLHPSSPAAQDIIDRFNKENIAKSSRAEEFVTMQSFQEDAFLDDIDFPEMGEYEEMHVSERSPGATQEDISKQLQDIQESYYEMKSTSPADAGVPITTPRKSPIPKRPLTLHFEDDDQGFSFTVPEFQSPDRLQFESPPYYTTSPGSPASPSDFLDEFDLPKPLKYSRMKRIKRPTPSPPRPKETQIMTTITQQSPLFDQLSQARLEETASKTQPSPRSPPKYLQQDTDNWSFSELPEGETSLFEDFLDFPTSPDPIPAEGYALPAYEDVVDIFTEEPPFDLSGELPESPVVSPRTPSPRKRKPYERPNRSPEGLRAVRTRLFPKEDETPKRMSPESPISSPESPMALRARLYQRENEPYKHSKITRASRAPRMRSVREITETYEDMDTQFLERVEASGSKIRRRRKKLDMNACHLGNVAESPIKVPTMYEVEGYLPDLPEAYPEDLIGSVTYATPTRQRSTPIDTTPPKNLPSPLRPEGTVVPGWISPPHLKTTPLKRRQQLLPSMGENVRVSKGMRDILQLEIHPSEMAYSPPPISPTEAATFKSELPQKPLQRSPPKTPPKASERERESILEEELEPEEMMYSSPVASPKTPSPTRSSPQSPIDTPESPRALKLRLLESEEPEYYSKSSMPVFVGKRMMHVKRHSAKPKVHSLREIREDYSEEIMPFLSQVESATKKFTKRMRKIKMSASQLDEIAESPVKVPNMFEADDPTGLKYKTDELQRKYEDLPHIYQQYPDDLMGSIISIEQTSVHTTMDQTPPRNLPSPIRPLAGVPGWGSPQRMKTSSTRDGISVLPGRSENLRMPKSKRDILLQEGQPGDIAFSPPPLTDLEKAAMKARFAPKSPKTPIVTPREEKEYSPQLRLTPTRTIELIEDEIFEEDLEIDNVLAETPPRQEQFPESPPESPRDFRHRLILADSPEYLDRPYMDVVTGRKRRRIKRHSAPPKVHSLREIYEGYDDENMPFWSKVESVGKLPPKRHKRIRKAALESKMEELSLREEPLTAPTMFEVDDTTGFRRMREEIENRLKGLPPLPQEYPEDLMETGTGTTWQPLPGILDRQLPENLPLPLQAQSLVPGWKTPPDLKKTKVKSTSPFKVKLKPEVRDILFQEMPPSEMLYSSPPPRTPEQSLSEEMPLTEMLYSPPSPPIRTPRQSPVKSPKSSLIPKPSPILSPQFSHTPPRTFEQIPSTSTVELLDDEMLWDDLPYESPISREISYQLPEIRKDIPKRKKPSAADKYLARQATMDARKLLMEEEEYRSPFREPPPRPLPEKKKEIRKPKRPSARYLAQQAAMEKKKQKTPEPPLSPDQYITQREKPSMADKYLARLATRDARKLLMEEEEGVITEPTSSEQRFSGKREQEVKARRKPITLIERVEEVIEDVENPHIPRRPPAVTLRNQEFSLPQWSPKLPQRPTEWDVIDSEFVPEGVQNYQSPKTPPPSPQKTRTPSPKQPTPKTPPRTIFEYAEDEDFLDDTIIPDEDLFESPVRPPTPPRLEDFYQVHTPPSPGDPDNLAQSLREHRFTQHRYDRPRKLMNRFVQIKNKRIPVRKSRPPKVATIEESDLERIPSERVPRKIREFPDFKPIRLDFESPPRPEKVTLPKKFAYVPGSKYKEEVSYTSPPRWFGSPEPMVEEEELVEGEEIANMQQLPNYDLPRANYYGSPGREFVRTPFAQRKSPRRAFAETVTVTEYEYPFEDYNFPHLDTTPIQPPSDEDVAGFNWKG